MKKRIDVQLWHEGCWMLALTRAHPDVTLVVTDICFDGTDVLATVVLSAPDGTDLESIEKETHEHGAVRATDVLSAGRDFLRIHTRYDANASIYTPIIESSFTPVGEIRVANDRERWTLIGDASEISASIAALESVATVDVSRVIDYEHEALTNRDLIDEVGEALSARQRLYLLSAFDEGYYQWPREISATELAGRHDVSGPTALEHLRKGEARILRRVIEELRAREPSLTER